MITGKCCNCGHEVDLHEFRMGPGPRGPIHSKKALRKFQQEITKALSQEDQENDSHSQDQERWKPTW